jgi:hypothetical protein
MDEDLMDEVGKCEYVDENSGVNLRFSHGEFFFWKKRVIACLLACLRSATRGVSHGGLAIYIKKYLKAKKEELTKLKYFTMQKYYNLQKILLAEKRKKEKESQNPSRYFNSVTNLQFQHKPKKYHLSRILISK